MPTLQLPLTQGRFAVIDEDDAWALELRWHVTAGYPARAVWRPKRMTIYLHRAVAERTGMLNDMHPFVDHVNGDRFDCRRSNLRGVTLAENNANRSVKPVSGCTGVYRDREKGWYAQIRRNGERRTKYGFATIEEAAAWREEQRSAMGARI